MTDLTNFTDTSDVSDAAIEWLIGAGVIHKCLASTPAEVRKHVATGSWCYAFNAVIAARLIQHHRPDLLVDPVNAIVREELAKGYEAADMPAAAEYARSDGMDDSPIFTAAKRLYLMGIEKGKGA